MLKRTGLALLLSHFLMGSPQTLPIMSIQPSPQIETIILCDDIRDEIGNKCSIMGIYDHHISAPKIPYVLPKLCFYVKFNQLTPIYTKFSFIIIDPNKKTTRLIVDSLITPSQDIDKGVFKVIASPFEIKNSGIYTVIITLKNDSKSYDYEYRFAISNNGKM